VLACIGARYFSRFDEFGITLPPLLAMLPPCGEVTFWLLVYGANLASRRRTLSVSIQTQAACRFRRMS
jgi:hypothetical protein